MFETTGDVMPNDFILYDFLSLFSYPFLINIFFYFIFNNLMFKMLRRCEV